MDQATSGFGFSRGGTMFYANLQLSAGLRVYLTIIIIPRAQMGYESTAHEAEWAIDSEPMRARGIFI